MIQQGDILLINNKSFNLFSIGQRLFTGQSYTHVAVGMDVLNTPSYMGADQLVVVQQFDNLVNANEDYQVWRPVANKDKIKEALTEIYKQCGAETYGYLQIPWFIYRWFWEKFGRNVKHKRPWFSNPKQVICSELGWKYLSILYKDNQTVINFLNQWAPKCFHSGDMKTVVYFLKYLTLFNKVGERWTGKY